jgi:hypothetical protein
MCTLKLGAQVAKQLTEADGCLAQSGNARQRDTAPLTSLSSRPGTPRSPDRTWCSRMIRSIRPQKPTMRGSLPSLLADASCRHPRTIGGKIAAISLSKRSKTISHRGFNDGVLEDSPLRIDSLTFPGIWLGGA